MIQEQAQVFRNTLHALGKPLPSDFPVLRNIVIAPDKRTALKDAGPALAESYRLFGQWGLFREVTGGDEDGLELTEFLAERIIIGSPEQRADALIQLHESIWTNRLIARVQWMGMERRIVLRSIELLSERVQPLVDEAIGGSRPSNFDEKKMDDL